MSTAVVNEEELQDTPLPEEPPEEARRFVSSTPYFTIIILASIVIVFLAQLTMPLETSILLAGNVKELVAEGQVWRLLTSSVVHGSIFHIGFNGYALFMLGRLMETLSNRSSIAIVFLIAAVAGSFLSFIFLPETPSVGASGGIIGLLGYITVYSYKRRKLLTSALLKNMLFNIAFIGFIGVFILPNVDNYGHLGGLLAGALFGLIEIPSDLYKDPRESGKFLTYAGYASLGVILLTALLTLVILLSAYVIYYL